MKRILLFLVVMFAGLSYNVSAQVPDEARESYLFSIYLTGDGYYNTPETVRILYNTATQTNLVMPKTFIYGKGWLYYLKVTENPVSFTITPTEGYGITSARCSVPTKDYKVTPDGFSVYASDMPVDTSVPYYSPVEVRTTQMSNIRTGRLVINADKPEGLNIQNRTGNMMRLYTGDDFVDGRLEILYSPETEKGWSVTREDKKEIFKTSLDDEPLSRTNVVFYKTLNLGELRSAFILNLSEGPHTVNVVRDHTDIDIPLKIRVESNGKGNEVVQSILNEKITSVKINGNVVDRTEWESEAFTVKNGSTVTLSLAETEWGVWEVNRRTLNGEKVTSNTFFIEGDDATPQEIVIRGLVNTPFRYTVKAENYDKFRMRVSNSDVELTSNEYSGAQPFFNGMTYNVDVYTKASTGYKVKGVKLNGTVVDPDEEGDFRFSVDSQDAVIEVDCQEYVRNLKMPVRLGKEKYNAITFVLDPNGPMEERIEFNDDTEILYNAEDLPVAIENASQYVYVGGNIQKKNSDGYFLEDYTPGQTVRVYTTGGNPITVTYKEFPAGVNAIITHDGVAVQPNASYVVAPYTKVKITPISGNNLVLEGSGNRLIEKSEDGSFEVDLSFHNEELWLHPENPYVDIVCNEGKLGFSDLESDRMLIMEGLSERFILPYTGKSDETFTFKVFDPDMIYSVQSVSSTPSGAVFNQDTYTISGIKSGMTLNIELSKKEKPYEFSFNVIPGVPFIKEDGESGFPIFYEADENGDYALDDNGEKKQLEMLQWSAVWAENSSEYGGYAIPLQYGVTSSLALGEGNGLSAEDFPVRLRMPIMSDQELYEFPYTFFINGKVYDRNTVDFYGDVTSMGYDDYMYKYRYEYQVVIDEPQSIDAKFYLTNLESGTVKLTSDVDFSYSIDGGERVALKAGSSKTVDIYPEQTLAFYAAEGETITFMKVKDALTQSVQNYSKPEGGVWTWTVPVMAQFVEWRPYEVTLEGERMTMTVKIDDSKAQLLINGGRKGSNDVWSLRKSNSIVVTSALAYRIIEATDGNGNPLVFDVGSGTIYGVEDGMTINLKTEKYVRDRNLYFITSDSKNTKVKLAPSTTKETELSFGTSTSEVRKQISYHVADWPFYVNVGTKAALYLNNKRISYNEEADLFNFPSEIPDGSVIRVVPIGTTQKTANTATVKVDEDLMVNLIVDGRLYEVAEGTSTMTIPGSSTVQVAAKADNKYNFTAIASYKTTASQDFVFENSASTLRVGVGMDKVSISITKDYHKLTLNAAEGVDMSKVSVVAEDAVCEIGEGNVVNIPTHISKATMRLTEADKYIAGVSSDVEGLGFNSMTGELSGLATATLTLDVQPVTRDKSMNVYVSSDELSGGVMALGAGTVVAKDVAVSVGFNNVNYGGLDAPVIYKPILSMNESGEGYDTSSLPIVYVNGERLDYNETLNGFVIGEDVLTSEIAPVVKIYPVSEGDENGEVRSVHVNYIVENGISFKAVEDNVVEITEVAQRRLLPGTKIEFTAESETGDPIYVEVDGERVEPVEGVYSFVVENEDLNISVMHQKIQITVNAEDWQNMRVSGGGLDYPLYDAVSNLYFPLSTTEVSIVSHVEGRIVTAVTDADGGELDYDMVTGVLKGITGNLIVNVVLGDYLRASDLHIYLEETGAEQLFLSELVLGEGTAVEKSLTLSEGYNTIQIGSLDLPLAFRCVDEVGTPAVYLNDEMLNYNSENGLFEFPDELPEIAVLKVFASAQPVISLNYDVEAEDYELNIVHDKVVNIDKPGNHNVLPGTEIRITVTPKHSLEPSAYIKPMAEAEDDELKVKVNDELLTPEADGSYVVKVKAEHADNGLTISIKQPINTSALMEVFADGKQVDIYSVAGVLIKKSASPEDVRNLVPGVYIMAGSKIIIR